MLPKDLAAYLWLLTGRHRLTGFQGATLLALLACNLNGHAPTAGELARHCPHSQRATGDALEALTAPDGPALAQRLPGTPTRYTLARFAHLLPKKDALPGANVSGLPPSPDAETPQRRDATQNHSATPQEPRNGSREFCAASPRAEKAVSSNEVNGNGALKTPPDSSDDLTQLRALCDFAAHVCRIESADAALLHALENYGAKALQTALEQYHYAYTQRKREAHNPAGQILAWCKKPETMDRLPFSALTFARWKEKREALQNAPQETPAPPPLRAAPEISEAEQALKRAWTQYALGHAPKPSAELEEAARRARMLRENAKQDGSKPA